MQIRFIMGPNAKVKGITVGSREQFEAMCRAIALHQIKPVIDKTFAFDEPQAAFQHMQGQSHFGKIAIDLTSA